ncbi:MAG: ACT domain-containing protein [Acidimicrobiales bacterium]
MTRWSLRARPRRSGPLALGEAHRSQVEIRRAAAARLVGSDVAVSGRIASAPGGYLLAHRASDIARHCGLLSPLPAAGEVRVVTTPGLGRGEWRLDVASRDRPGLLAAFTGVLVRQGVDVAQAVLATWDDGGALEAFVVRCPDPPEPEDLQRALEASLDQPLSSPPVPGARVSFANGASPLYTSCEVCVADRPGLLHAMAVAIASAGADVHAACVTTVDGLARDRFDLSDRAGHRLDPSLEEAIRGRIRSGVSGAGRGRARPMAPVATSGEPASRVGAQTLRRRRR